MKSVIVAISFVREDLGSSLGCQSLALDSSGQKLKISRLAISMPTDIPVQIMLKR
jgi:hypothetical protein